MFLDLDQKDPAKFAAVDDSGRRITYGDITAFVAKFAAICPKRTLVMLLAENSIGSLLGYLAMLSNRIVPLILSAKTEDGLYGHLRDLYQPEFLWMPKTLLATKGGEVVFEAWDFVLVKTGLTPPPMYDDLSLLLPTSGSTGSPKLVRHCYRNIEANAENVMNLFQLTPDERAMAILPMHYTMGLSVVASHLKAGASLILSGRSLLDVGFWKMLKEERATSFTGVPYSYDLLMKLRFARMALPDLRTITQGGGKLTPQAFAALADYAAKNGKKFIATYGQSECTARMAYLPAELALTKTCSIGIAEPGGKLSLIDDKGVETFEGEATGVMVYRGENVTLGYATSTADLMKGDENHGVMPTGDLAHRDADGCYFIVGRLKRFLKIFGLRIGLDEVEGLVKAQFEADCLCSGTDEKLTVNVAKKGVAADVVNFIEEKTHLFRKCIEVMEVDSIARNEAGKVVLHK